MHFLNVLPLALGVSSLLIPPQVDNNILHASKVLEGSSGNKFSVKCIGGCPLFRPASAKNKVSYFKAKNSDSELGFEITLNAERKLLFNGEQIWPRPALPPTLAIEQVVGSINLHEDGTDSVESLPLMSISTSIEYKEDVVVKNHGAMKVHPVSIEIMAVGGQVVQAERMVFTIVESEAGTLLSYYLTILPYQSSPLIDSCTNIWCRVRGTIALKYNEWHKAIANKVRGWRKCGGKAGHKMGHNAGGVTLKGGPNKFGPGSTLHPHGHHKHHHSKGGFFSILFRVIQIVFPPLILGFSIGMLVRAILNRIVPHMQSRGFFIRSDYVEVKQSDVEEARDSVDGPPKYEEVYGDELPAKEDEKK